MQLPGLLSSPRSPNAKCDVPTATAEKHLRGANGGDTDDNKFRSPLFYQPGTMYGEADLSRLLRRSLSVRFAAPTAIVSKPMKEAAGGDLGEVENCGFDSCLPCSNSWTIYIQEFYFLPNVASRYLSTRFDVPFFLACASLHNEICYTLCEVSAQ
jgi:hypothetical protein